MKATQRIVVKPGESVQIVLVETLVNGYPDETGYVTVRWQDRDAPVGEIAKLHRELQIESRPLGGKVGPVVVTHR